MTDRSECLPDIFDRFDNEEYEPDVLEDMNVLINLICAYEIRLREYETETHRLERELSRTYK